jgi:hypothetical protein
MRLGIGQLFRLIIVFVNYAILQGYTATPV